MFTLLLSGCSGASFIEDVDGIKIDIAEWPYNSKKVVCFTWDDSSTGHTRSTADLMGQFGYPSTFYIITSRLAIPGIEDECEYALSLDNELASHSVSHPLFASISPSEVDYELRKSAEDIKEHFGVTPSTFGHPYRHNDDYDDLVEKYYMTSRYRAQETIPGVLVHVFNHRDTYDSLSKLYGEFIHNEDYSWLLFKGHGLSSDTLGECYEPLDSIDFRRFLGLMKADASSEVITMEDVMMYYEIKQNVSIVHEEGTVFVNTDAMNALLSRYSHPKAIITLLIKGANPVLSSEAIVDVRYDDTSSIVTLDLRRGNTLSIL